MNVEFVTVGLNSVKVPYVLIDTWLLQLGLSQTAFYLYSFRPVARISFLQFIPILYVCPMFKSYGAVIIWITRVSSVIYVVQMIRLELLEGMPMITTTLLHLAI